MKHRITIFFLVAFCNILLAQEGFKTKTVSIFKNGSAFFTKEGTIKPKNNQHTILLETMPRASYGTFWLSGKDLKELKSYRKSYEKYKTSKFNNLSSNTLGLLKNNIGKNAVLYFSKDEAFEGMIKGVTGEIVLLEKDGSWMNLPHKMVKWVILKEAPTGLEIKEKKDTIKYTKNVVELNFSSNKKQNLELVYFLNNIGWIPSYKIELLDEEKAQISMQAGVFNDAEDLKNVDLNFVVGYPNLKYAQQLDLFFAGSYNNFASQLGRSNNSNYLQFADQALRGGAYDIQLDEVTVTGLGSNGSNNAPPNLKAESAEDLFFYKLKNITLPKGGRAYFSVFQDKVSYEHIYEVKLTTNHSNYNYYYNPSVYDNPYRNKVWHTIKLKNDTKNVWTNGAAMVLKINGKDIQPISQDDLPYTSIGGDNSLKLTIAPDVSVKDYEKETNRQVRQKQKDDKYYYDIVTVKGEIKLHNYKGKEIRLDLKKDILGNLKESNTPWLKTERVNLNNRYHKMNNVCWEIKLKAGEKKVIEYEYEVYVRR